MRVRTLGLQHEGGAGIGPGRGPRLGGGVADAAAAVGGAGLGVQRGGRHGLACTFLSMLVRGQRERERERRSGYRPATRPIRTVRARCRAAGALTAEWLTRRRGDERAWRGGFSVAGSPLGSVWSFVGAERECWRNDRANGNGTRHRIYAARDRRMPPCRAAEGRPTLASVYGLRSVRTAQPHASTCEAP